MIMTTWQGVVTVLMAVLGTIITRFLPFVLFPESKKPPHIIDYLGNVLPYAMTGLLVVYSLKNVNPFAGSHGIPEAIAIAAIVVNAQIFLCPCEQIPRLYTILLKPYFLL